MTIKSTSQLKSLIRNQSKASSIKAQIILRHYVMERYLERVSISPYKNRFIFKGGVLISSIIGIDNRSTLDIDATLKNINLDGKSIGEIVNAIIRIDLEDHVKFVINQISPIMEEFDYPGIRVSITAYIDKIRTPLKLDFSTGDVITPNEIVYNHKLMFENRSISILAYNLETILAEKFETIISRGILNSRMRDFYDIYMIMVLNLTFDTNIFSLALNHTSTQRGSITLLKDWKNTLLEINNDERIVHLWTLYQNKFEYAYGISLNEVMYEINRLGELLSF